jgi:beta-mannosidase
MAHHMSLSGGDWHFKDFYGEDWRWRDAHKPDTRDTRHWRVGTVPGSVHHDLWTLGEIPDPYFERNSLLLEWIPARTWIYKKTFFVAEDLRGKRLQLHFEGVDYEAEFFLNGDSLGTHSGMFTPAIFDVSEQVNFSGDNLLTLVIEPVPHEQPQVSRTSKVRTHKSRMTYWWDFCPRMIHIGIWDHVYLDVADSVRIDDVFVRPQLSADFRRADINLSLELDAASSQTIQVETILRFGDEVITSQRVQHDLSTGKATFQHTLTVEQPLLWWPNGYGEQPLYQAEIYVRKVGDTLINVLDQRLTRFGIRKIELVPNETADPTARPYTFVVNGRKLYIKGWNWVPLDVLYGVERPEKLNHLLHLAQRAHVNLLRVWGGGLIEKESFYNRCDELGIMVWQEFIHSSSGIENNPSEAREFIDLMVGEAEHIIPRKRNHPSLVLWCGGNELSEAPEQPLHDSHPLLAALKSVVNRLDPDRYWLPTSPTGRVFMNSLANIERDASALHDVHGPWEYQGLTRHYELYNRSTSLLHSEFGVEGLANRKSLNATIAPENQWPATLDNPIYQHRGAWWNQQAAWYTVFGAIDDIETLTHATQFLQAEGLRYALESDRRRKYHNSGTLPWQFNEPYPMATCTSAVDYYGQAKPGYYAVARAYQPLQVSASFPTIAWAGWENFEADIWVNNSHESSYDNLNLTVKILGLSGRIYSAWTQVIRFTDNSAARIFSVSCPLSNLNGDSFFLDISLQNSQDRLLAHNRYPFTRAASFAPLLTVPMTDVKVNKQDRGDAWLLNLTNTGNYAALWLWLEDSRPVGASGYACFDDNHFCLLPQETRSIWVKWDDVAFSERGLDVRGWNTALWRL